MINRREFLVGTVAAALAGLEDAWGAAGGAGVNFDVPEDACDCHTHFFGDPKQFPFYAGRGYTPPPAGTEEMAALHRRLRIRRVVIVTPSVYGTDNSATQFGMRARGRDARGIAVIDDRTGDEELASLKAAGFRGIRLNLGAANVPDPAVAGRRLERAIERCGPLGWHVQILTDLNVIRAIKRQVLDSPLPVVFDQFGSARAELGITQPGFHDLVDLVGSGRAYVKTSGAYRCSSRAPDYPDVAPLARALIAANSDRIVWGSDWPHADSRPHPGRRPTDVSPPLPVDDVRLFEQLPVWASDAATRRKILVENPVRLYGF
jgi:predicted TIM-barrel fold metal-dependent hydrolase